MTKNELYTELLPILETMDADSITILLCNWFDSSELEEFTEFAKEEQQ